jgi:NarL family two-component system sensor histidine kinase LiaS
MIDWLRSLFRGLNGKLTLTYTLVTVLALMALEALILAFVLLLSTLNRTDERSYLNDVIYTLYPRASEFLQPGAQDIPGLQAWLDDVAASGYASMPPQNVFDSPAATIVTGDPILVLSPDLTVLAQSSPGPNNLVGRKYTPPDDSIGFLLDEALSGNFDPLALSSRTSAGNYRLAIPVTHSGFQSPLRGVILITLAPAPAMIRSTWPVFLAWVLVTGLVLVMAVAPFGALFGFIMSRGLTRRLSALTRAADAWSEGNFQFAPTDRSRDEIGVLAVRMRNMAERIQALLHTQQELAALEERSRLARDLHDTVKQQNFATLMQIRAARNLVESDPRAAIQRLVEAEGLVRTSQEELGLMITELRPAALEGQGLAAALRAYLAQWSEHTRIPAEVQVTNERSLPLAVEQALYRVAQEALSNTARHSRASAASLRLEFTPAEIHLEISDNGVGFDVAGLERRGFGLESMHGRLTELGGRLEIESTPGQGTRVRAEAPF